MATNFQIKLGKSENLERATPIPGCWYLTTDTFELFACFDETIGIQPIKATGSFDPERVTALEAEVKDIKQQLQNVSSPIEWVTTNDNLPMRGSENIVYIVINEDASYMWSNEISDYVCIGRNYEEITVIHGGTAD